MLDKRLILISINNMKNAVYIDIIYKNNLKVTINIFFCIIPRKIVPSHSYIYTYIYYLTKGYKSENNKTKNYRPKFHGQM